MIVVEQTDVVQNAVLTFFEKLRTARGKPLRSQLDPQRFTLDTHTDRAREQLERPVTASYVEPTPLVEIVQYLEEVGQTTIVVDWPALAKNTEQFSGLPVVLAGGLTPFNVAEAIATVRPAAVDTASGVEASLGKKDPMLVRAFVNAAKKAFQALDEKN